MNIRSQHLFSVIILFIVSLLPSSNLFALTAQQVKLKEDFHNRIDSLAPQVSSYIHAFSEKKHPELVKLIRTLEKQILSLDHGDYGPKPWDIFNLQETTATALVQAKKLYALPSTTSEEKNNLQRLFDFLYIVRTTIKDPRLFTLGSRLDRIYYRTVFLPYKKISELFAKTPWRIVVPAATVAAGIGLAWYLKAQNKQKEIDRKKKEKEEKKRAEELARMREQNAALLAQQKQEGPLQKPAPKTTETPRYTIKTHQFKSLN